MKAHAVIFAIVLSISSGPAFAATSISVRLFGLNIAVDRSTTFQNGEEFNLEVTSLGSSQPANGEMAALSVEESDYSNGGVFQLYEPLFFDGPIPMRFAVDLPPFLDSDVDGIHDFLRRPSRSISPALAPTSIPPIQSSILSTRDGPVRQVRPQAFANFSSRT